jgi:hypothetical protein
VDVQLLFIVVFKVLFVQFLHLEHFISALSASASSCQLLFADHRVPKCMQKPHLQDTAKNNLDFSKVLVGLTPIASGPALTVMTSLIHAANV